MSTSVEVNSLNDIQYKSKVKIILWILLILFLFIFSFINSYPIGAMVKSQLKKQLAGSTCNPEFSDIRIEWLMPKIVISDLALPASCFNRQGESIKFNFVNINYHLINFSPIGLPFRIDTEISGQPLSIYFVQGIGEQLIRLKDQQIVLTRLQELLGDFKMTGSLTVDLGLSMAGSEIKSLELKAASKDFSVPAQNISAFGIPQLKLKEFYLEASGDYPRLAIKKLILGDSAAPLRANLRGKIDLQSGGMAFSPMELTGELFLSESLKQTAGWLELLVQSFPQKDGFYQVKLGGTLGAPKPL